MTTYFIDKDGYGDETLWRQENRRVEGCTCAAAALGGALGSGHESYCGWDEDDEPQPVIRRVELGEHADLLWPIVTGVLTEDDAAAERVARALIDASVGGPYHMGGGKWAVQGESRDLARAALAALREVSS